MAWPNLREGVSRIYYRRSTDGGKTWQGPSSGQPLLIDAQVSDAKQDHFMPQLISRPSGQIGCAFYEFGPRGTEHLIDVVLAVSSDNGQSFSERVTITDYPWDPTVSAPFSHGNPSVTFIGEYFGLDASKLGFYPAWTDTRTGMQKIFTARIFVNPTKSSQEKSPETVVFPTPGGPLTIIKYPMTNLYRKI